MDFRNILVVYPETGDWGKCGEIFYVVSHFSFFPPTENSVSTTDFKVV